MLKKTNKHLVLNIKSSLESWKHLGKNLKSVNLNSYEIAKLL